MKPMFHSFSAFTF